MGYELNKKFFLKRMYDCELRVLFCLVLPTSSDRQMIWSPGIQNCYTRCMWDIYQLCTRLIMPCTLPHSVRTVQLCTVLTEHGNDYLPVFGFVKTKLCKSLCTLSNTESSISHLVLCLSLYITVGKEDNIK